MKTRAIAVPAILGLLVLGSVAVAFAHPFGLNIASNQSPSGNSAQNFTSHSASNHTGDQNNETEDQNNQGQNNQGEGGHFNLTVGTTLTFANLTGHWVAFSHVGNHTGEDDNNTGDSFSTQTGNATGSFTFKVASSSGDGSNLTITSGQFTINGTTYTVSGGSVTLNEGDESGFGTGTASGGATFQIHVAGIHGNTTSMAQVGAIKLDVTVGKSVYLVILGSNEGVEESASED